MDGLAPISEEHLQLRVLKKKKKGSASSHLTIIVKTLPTCRVKTLIRAVDRNIIFIAVSNSYF